LLTVGDVPHLAAMCAPRRLLLADGTEADGNRLGEKEFNAAFTFTTAVYKTHKSADQLSILTDVRPDDLARRL
jgi:hypothetical protein